MKPILIYLSIVLSLAGAGSVQEPKARPIPHVNHKIVPAQQPPADPDAVRRFLFCQPAVTLGKHIEPQKCPALPDCDEEIVVDPVQRGRCPAKL